MDALNAIKHRCDGELDEGQLARIEAALTRSDEGQEPDFDDPDWQEVGRLLLQLIDGLDQRLQRLEEALGESVVTADQADPGSPSLDLQSTAAIIPPVGQPAWQAVGPGPGSSSAMLN
jgi:hypothetical protein